MKVLVNYVDGIEFKESVKHVYVAFDTCIRISELKNMKVEEKQMCEDGGYPIGEILDYYDRIIAFREREPKDLYYVEVTYTLEDDCYNEDYITNDPEFLRNEIFVGMQKEFLSIDEYKGLRYKLYNAIGEVLSRG